MRTDETFMRLAIRAARAGIRRGQTPFGACLVLKGQPVAVTHNRVWSGTDITAHAEILALRKACRVLRTVDLEGATMVSTCEPCPMCFAACHWAGIRRILYGARIRDARRAGFRELAISAEVMARRGGSAIRIKSGVLAAECQELFREWLRHGEVRRY